MAIDRNAATAAELITEEFMVPARDPEIRLYVRNKHSNGIAHFPSEKILLYVHGATYPSETAFDLKLDGLSWMDYIARHGHDVYLVDVRGYGKSTRLPELDKPATESEPVERAQSMMSLVRQREESLFGFCRLRRLH